MTSSIAPLFVTRSLSLFFVLGLTFFVVATAFDIDASEANELQQLRSQINALIVQRRDDSSKLEAIARNSLNKDAEIDQLRNEIRDVKMELDSMKTAAKSWPAGSADSGGNRMKNEQLTVEWLSNSISEIRTELAEMLRSYNSTATLQQQQRQAFTTDISILQNDVVSLRHNVEHSKADVAKYNAKLTAFAQDVDALKQSTSSVAAKVVNYTQQIRALSAVASAYDWSTVMRPLKKNQQLAIFKKMIVLNENPLKMQIYTSTRRRRAYRRHRRRHCHDVDENETHEQRHFTSSAPGSDFVSSTANEKQQNSKKLPKRQGSVESDSNLSADVIIASLEKRVGKLENLVETQATGSRSKGQDKLRSSMLELLESVENIEAKFDNVTPVLKKEISKMEFSLAQIVANLSVARQHQENDRMSMTTIAENVSKTQSKCTLYEYKLSVMEEKLGNVLSSFNSCTNCMQQQQNFEELWWSRTLGLELGINSTAEQHASAAAISKLLLLHNQYADFVRRLPKDCNEVNGGSDLYLISVGISTPILVFCEKKMLNNVDVESGNGDIDSYNTTRNLSNQSNVGYIVIQRRTNGQTDFNKNWQEYARGFGNLRNEFWLGNELIHRLTENNDTSLRIELEDVTGRRWFAEYDTFSVASRQQEYALFVDGFSGNTTDAFQQHNQMRFSTKDSDHDMSDTNCAAEYECGWWYSRCQHTNLNAKYNSGFTWFDSARNEWIALSSTKMMLTKKRRI